MDEITINGVVYVPKGSAQTMAEDLEGMQYCMVRSAESGVWAGYIQRRDGAEVEMRQARRIWYWKGAATLSQLATDGTSEPDECKFPCPVAAVTVLGVCEIIPITAKAKASIDGVEVWEE